MSSGAPLRAACAVLLAAFGFLAGCSRGQAGGEAPPQGPAEKERISASAASHLERTLEEMLSTLEDNYVYGKARGVAWSALRDRYLARVKALAEVAEFASLARAVLGEIGDPDVVWQSREERIAAELEYSTRYEGIGTYIAFRDSPVPRVIILDVIPGSPAERAGVLPHDAIVSIDGQAVRAGEGQTVAQRIRGPRGTDVRLSLRRPGGSRLELLVPRERVELSGVQYPLRFGMVSGTSVGYVRLPRAASDSLVAEIPEALDRLRGADRATALVLDLRISGSGSFPLEELLAFFADGRLGTAYTSRDSGVIEVRGRDRAGSQSIPLAVLVGPDTEGAAEIFAGALQAAGRGFVVGSRTPGSVEREQQFALVDGSRLWMPVWSYRVPGGRELGLEGIRPDLTVEADWDAVSETADATMLAAARELQLRRRG